MFLLGILASLSGSAICAAQLFDEAKFDRLVSKIEGDVLELAREVEKAYSNRCDVKHLSNCVGSSYDHCLSSLPDQTCPGGVDLDTPECSGDGNTCSALYSYTSSSVALPRNLAQGPDSNPTDPSVIETVCFTKDLDSYFVNKRQQDEAFWTTLVGQQPSSMHFGSTSGAFRLYPARVYSSCGEYDPRLRPWYVAASSGPKNVVLVLDRSGSMNNDGRMELMKEAAKRIIQATTVSDRIAIVTFDEEIEAITDSGSVFIATAENKLLLEKKIDSLKAHGATNFYDAFRTAFDILDQSYIDELIVDCNTAIIFLTDGFMSHPPNITEADVLQLVIDRTRQTTSTLGNPVYLFTYSISEIVGTLPSELACAVETGVYAKIENAEDIVESLSEYYKFFALGLGSDVNQDFVAWVEPYKWIPGDAIGTTVSAPVFDRTKQPHLFLGVVGIDFTLKALDAALGVTNSSDQESFRRVVKRATARCPRLEFSTCELESYRLQGTAGAAALCTNNCTADDFVQVTEQACPGISDYPSNLWDNTDNRGIPFIESVCCVVGDNIPNPVCIRDFEGNQTKDFEGNQTKDFEGNETKASQGSTTIIIACAAGAAIAAVAAFVWSRSRKTLADGPNPSPSAPLPKPMPPPMAPPNRSSHAQ